MENLGGHCLETLLRGLRSIADDRPTVFLAYTIKGWGTPLAGHKDNHAGLMTPAQMAALQTAMGVAEGQEWNPFAAVPAPCRRTSSTACRFCARAGGASLPAVCRFRPARLTDRVLSTQAAFGKILDDLARKGGRLAERIVTTSPDVTVSTNLGPWVNRRGLFCRGHGRHFPG